MTKAPLRLTAMKRCHISAEIVLDVHSAGNMIAPNGEHADGGGGGATGSRKREKRNGSGSTTGRGPLTRSAMSRPAPGPMPKPWPEKPVATKNPGRLSTGEMTGTRSGVTSIIPAQVSAIL